MSDAIATPAATAAVETTPAPATTSGADSSPAPAAATPAPVTTLGAPAPIVYDLKLPEKSSFDAAVLERTVAHAKALGLSPEHAQKDLEFWNQETATRVEAEKAAEREAALAAMQPGGAEWLKAVEGWRAETLADTALGATPAERKAAIDKGHGVIQKYVEQYPKDGEAFKAFINTSGLGDHPTAVRLFAWLGKAMGEGTLVLPDAKAGPGALSEDERLRTMYPSMYPA